MCARRPHKRRWLRFWKIVFQGGKQGVDRMPQYVKCHLRSDGNRRSKITVSLRYDVPARFVQGGKVWKAHKVKGQKSGSNQGCEVLLDAREAQVTRMRTSQRSSSQRCESRHHWRAGTTEGSHADLGACGGETEWDTPDVGCCRPIGKKGEGVSVRDTWWTCANPKRGRKLWVSATLHVFIPE